MPTLDWDRIRRHYAALVAAARKEGRTQSAIAAAGGLPGQNAISKLLTNPNQGPSVETFVKAVQGLGKSVSEFFAEVEQTAGAPPVKSVLERLQDLEAAILALTANPDQGRPHVDRPPLSASANVVHIIERLDAHVIETIVQATFDRLTDRLAPPLDAHGNPHHPAARSRARHRRRARKTA